MVAIERQRIPEAVKTEVTVIVPGERFPTGGKEVTVRGGIGVLPDATFRTIGPGLRDIPGIPLPNRELTQVSLARASRGAELK